ncbi:AraC family transcriptional regulator [Piscinibacter sp.]|jgi:AraC-like DNA-binding protein|uniref:AraC family transcriptional regulator n=1 Tax=Piscinibacter sp. TaxID=1903157 RepID=UPI00355A7D76
MKPMLMSDVGWCKAMKDAFVQSGLDADALLAQAGFDFNATGEVDIAELTDAFSRAWELAVEQTGNPAIGLTVPSHPLNSLGVLSHMVLSASDVRGALQAIVRFTHLISPTASIDVKFDGDRCFLILQIAPGRRAVPSQRYDFYSTVILHAVRWITGRAVTPLVFHHPGAAPVDPAPWRDAFGCPVNFGSADCMLELSVKDLALPIPTADPAVADLCERIATQVAEQQGGSVSIRVRQVLMKHLAKGDPRRETMAAMLCMSERTLQRRLTEEGTSFAELVDEVRRELAQRYFAHSTISPTEITFALGFSDPSNFYRACKRWFGRSPSTMRCSH